MTTQNIGERLKDGIFVGVSILGLERNFFTAIANATPDDLYLLIEANKPWVIPDQALSWTRGAYKKFSHALERYTPEYILEKLRTKRPELYSVITTHPAGRTWLENRLAELRKQLQS